MEAGTRGNGAGGGPRGRQPALASAGMLAPSRELVQDHIAGLGPRCGGTAMQGKNKALPSGVLAKQTKLAADAGGLRMLFLRRWHKYPVEKKQENLFPSPCSPWRKTYADCNI